MVDTGTDSKLTRWGSIGTGIFSFVGGIAIVLSVLISIVEYQQATGRGIIFLLVEFPLSYVGFPAALLVGWLFVGGLLLSGRSWAPPLGAVAFFGAVLVNLVVIVTQVLRVRPVFLWFVDPVTPFVSIPLGLLRIAGMDVLPPLMGFYLPGGLGTVGSGLLGIFLAIISVQEHDM